MSADLFIEADDLQELDGEQQTGLVVLVSDVEKLLEVAVAQGVQHSPVHQMSLEGLGVLRQPHVAQPRRCNPVMVHLRGL